MTRTVMFALLVICCVLGVAVGQDAVPGEILQRTILIRTATEQATAFTMDYQGRLYVVTARHVVSGLPTDNPTIQFRRNGTWSDLHLKKILFPPSDDVDIAVFKSDENALKPFGIAPMATTGGVTMGQQVWFLGYPFLEGLGSHWSTGEAPFIKRGTMSAIDGTNPDAVVLYIDGFNNKGFSGGPIVYWDFTDHVYKVFGVVKGYKPENAQVMINGQPVDTSLLVNSGILVGYSIGHAIQAIEKDQEHKK